ncbi:hypothetical protein KCV03_g198, partial [Aureobasidium melanogenum]
MLATKAPRQHNSSSLVVLSSHECRIKPIERTPHDIGLGRLVDSLARVACSSSLDIRLAELRTRTCSPRSCADVAELSAASATIAPSVRAFDKTATVIATLPLLSVAELESKLSRLIFGTIVLTATSSLIRSLGMNWLQAELEQYVLLVVSNSIAFLAKSDHSSEADTLPHRGQHARRERSCTQASRKTLENASASERSGVGCGAEFFELKTQGLIFMAKLLLQSLRLSIKPCFQSLLTGVETCLDVGSLKGNRHQDSITAWEMQQSCHTYEGAAVTRV